MSGSRNTIGAIIVAAAVCGPATVTAYYLAWLYLQLPDPVTIYPQALGIFTAMTLPVLIGGFLIGFMPIMVCTTVLAGLADKHRALRDPLAWTAAGIAIGGALGAMSWQIAPDFATVFAIVAGAAITARTARAFIDWSEEPLDSGVEIRPNGARLSSPTR